MRDEVLRPLKPVIDSPAVEHEFRVSQLEADAKQTALVIGILLVPTLFFARSDYFLWGESPTFRMLFAARLAVVAVAAGAMTVCLRTRSPREYDRTVLLWSLASVALVLFVNLTRPPDYIQHSIIDVLVVLLLYLVAPNQLVLQAVPAALLTAGNVVIVLLFRDPLGAMTGTVMAISYFLAHSIGIGASWQLQRAKREEFLARRIESDTRDRLEDARAELEHLRGLLPVCASCGKARDDEAYRQRVENYVRERSDADFSRGLCAACQAERDPDGV